MVRIAAIICLCVVAAEGKSSLMRGAIPTAKNESLGRHLTPSGNPGQFKNGNQLTHPSVGQDGGKNMNNPEAVKNDRQYEQSALSEDDACPGPSCGLKEGLKSEQMLVAPFVNGTATPSLASVIGTLQKEGAIDSPQGGNSSASEQPSAAEKAAGADAIATMAHHLNKPANTTLSSTTNTALDSKEAATDKKEEIKKASAARHLRGMRRA